MVAAFKESIAEGIISEKLEDSLDEIRRNLEQTFQDLSLGKEFIKDLSKLAECCRQIPEGENLRKFEKNISNLLEETEVFCGKYRRFFKTEDFRIFEDLNKKVKGWRKDLRAINRMPSFLTPESSLKSFQSSALGIEVFARLIEEEDGKLYLEAGDAIREIAIYQRDSAGKAKLKDKKKEKYRQRILYATAFIIQQTEKRKGHNSEALIIGEEPLENLFKKSQERVKKLGWPNTKEEAEKLIVEEEETEKIDDATLKSLNRMLQDDPDSN